MENLKISEKLFEDVIYFVLGSLDDEVKRDSSTKSGCTCARRAVFALCLLRACAYVCVVSVYARLYICFDDRAAVHASATARSFIPQNKYIKHWQLSDIF